MTTISHDLASSHTWLVPDATLTRTAKVAVWMAVLSIMLFSQIAINFGDFPFSTDFFIYAVVAAYLIASGYAAFQLYPFAILIVAAATAVFVVGFRSSGTSWTSLLLLFALYAPFVFRFRQGYELSRVQAYIEATFVSTACAISIIAVVQLFAVNALGLKALTNVYFVLPEQIRGAGTYAFLRESGGIVKANGFFLRESATLSIVAALAAIIEFSNRARWAVLVILASGLLVSLSGSGFLLILAALVLPTSILRLPLFVLSAVVVSGVLVLTYQLQIPGFEFWFGRVTELQTPGTSGYARFVAPLQMVERSFEKGMVETMLGNGAGSYLREAGLLKLPYEVNDPTWAKLTFEYGLLGFMTISALFIWRLYASQLRRPICNAALVIWLSSGLVLKQDFAFMIWLLTLVPGSGRR